jgi:hypothetical protein
MSGILERYLKLLIFAQNGILNQKIEVVRWVKKNY